MFSTPIVTGSGPSDWYLGQIPFQLRFQSATELRAYQLGANFVNGGPTSPAFVNFAEYYSVSNTANLCDDQGNAAPGTPSASTLYYAYLVGIGDLAGTLALSQIAPTSNNGVLVLKSSTPEGCASAFVGLVYMNSAGEFQDDDGFRGVASYYYRRAKRLQLRPGYTNNNAQTNLAAFNSATFARVNGGTGDTGTYLSFGEDAAHFVATFCSNAALTAQLLVGIGDSSNTTPAAVACIGNAAVAGSSACVSYVAAPSSMSVQTVTMLAMSNGANVTFVADYARTGAAADPAATQLSGVVWG